MKYLDFDLTIEPSGDRFTALVSCPRGQASLQFAVPFDDKDIENILLRCGHSRRVHRRVDSQELGAVKQFGGKLFEAVFAGDLRGLLQSSLDEADRQQAGLRLRLRLGRVPALSDLPWEFLYNVTKNRFLCLSKDTPVVRVLDLAEAIKPVMVKLPLEVLLIVASPSDYDTLDVAQELAKMSESLTALEARGLVRVTRAQKPTLGELQQQLRNSHYHVLHFVGHGGFSSEIQDGVLMFEDERGRGQRVTAQELGLLLHDHRPLRLVVLNACEGARGSRQDPFAGTAQSLIQQGIPAVIAMQFEVSDDVAIVFTRDFYSSIAAGYPVEAALAEARKAIFSLSETEWATPVLYMRSNDGRLFDVEQAAGGVQDGVAAVQTSASPATAAPQAAKQADVVTPEVRVPAERAAPERAAAAARGVLDVFAADAFGASAALHCVVISPETRASDGSVPLVHHVRRAWQNFGTGISAAANHYRAATGLPPLPAVGSAQPDFVLAELRVEHAFRSEASLERAIEALCKAEVAVFDLTNFEAGVIFLLGIRAVARRGVTLTSIGGSHTVGAELDVPFNLQLLNLSAHSAEQQKQGDGRKPSDLIGDKIRNGFRELADLPHYLDLPAYEAVRQLGVESGAYRAVQYTEKVLLLCPFSREYSERNWANFIAADLPGELQEHVRRRGAAIGAPPRLERLLDLKTPRLVAQTLFESIRLTEMCLIDWTGLRANVMFEAGVRLATNPLGAVHIVEVEDGGTARMPAQLRQVEDMRRLFTSVEYRCTPGETGAYAEMIAHFEASLAANRDRQTGVVYRAVGRALDAYSRPPALPLGEELIRGANILESDDQESTGISPILYHEVNKDLVSEAREAAAERRLAAWLFLSRRHTPQQIAGDARLLEQFELLSVQTRRWARRHGRPELLEDIRTCQKAVGAQPRGPGAPFNERQEIARLNSRVKLHKEEAKDLRDDGDLEGAIATLDEAVAMVEASPLSPGVSSSAAVPDSEKALASHLADCLGMIGGNCRRLNRLDQALAYFARGRRYEEDERLDVNSSYNLVSAITLPLEMQTRTASEQQDLLQRAVAAIERQVKGARRTDRWAWADLGQCQLLLGDFDSAARSYGRVRDLGDSDTVHSVVTVLRRLSAAIERSDPGIAECLRKGIVAIGT